MTVPLNKITVVGSGYVGMSLAVLLAQEHKVKIYDIDRKKISKINKGLSPINDIYIEEYLKNKKLNLEATTEKNHALEDAEFVVIAAPTDFDTEKKKFNTEIVDSVIADLLKINKKCFIVIKSTLPIGHTKSLRNKFKTNNIVFSPEFLREGSALEDNLYPSRIIIGGACKNSILFTDFLVSASKRKDVKKIFVDSSEAEAIKLFSNTYLAMRVAFFNELDSFALDQNMSAKNIIDGMGLDNRIGDGYNNPSFGYGGYCLPKDSMQANEHFGNKPKSLMRAIVTSNKDRINFIANKILEKNTNCKAIGFYRLTMKKNSDNYRFSSSIEVLKYFQSLKLDIDIYIYEPLLKDDMLHGAFVARDLQAFKEISDVIVVNRLSENLKDVEEKCFTRDIYGIN